MSAWFDRRSVSALVVAFGLSAGSSAGALAQAHAHHDGDAAEQAQPAGAHAEFFVAMADVLHGEWSGRYTNGTFEQPTEWEPVRIAYMPTSSGTALVENYFYGEADTAGMTTVYHRDRGDLRLTHYCGAANHPSMIATRIDPERRRADFRFTGITNLQAETDYHSRELRLEIVSDDHLRIEYHGVQNGRIYSQAYEVRRDYPQN